MPTKKEIEDSVDSAIAAAEFCHQRAPSVATEVLEFCHVGFSVLNAVSGIFGILHMGATAAQALQPQEFPTYPGNETPFDADPWATHQTVVPNTQPSQAVPDTFAGGQPSYPTMSPEVKVYTARGRRLF